MKLPLKLTDPVFAFIPHVKYARPRRGPNNVHVMKKKKKKEEEEGTKVLAAFKIKTVLLDLCEVSRSL